MVFESIVADLLNKFLGDYVENLDKKQLKIGIWGGDVVLNNLSFRENALDDLDLPIQLVYGYLGKLVLKIPWKNLYSQPVVAEVEDLYILIAPKQSVKYDPAKEAKYDMQAKQAALLNLETRRAFEEEKKKVKGDPSFTEKLTAQIVNNLQIKIANVHIRYEDKTTAGQPVAFGITLCGLEIYTTDEEWERSYMTEQLSKVFKIADLDSLAAYMNCNTRMFMNYDITEFPELFKSNIACKGYFPKNYKYIAGPISVITKLQLNMNPERDEPPFVIPKIDLVLGMDKLNIGITRTQFQDILKVGDAMSRLRMGIPYRKYRPFGIPYRGHYKEWWNFAINSVLNEEVKRKIRNWSWEHIKQHRKLCKTYAETFKEKMLTKKPSANLCESVTLCETKLDIFNLILIRNTVYLELDAIKLEEELKASQKGWFSSWWGGSKQNDSDDSDLAKKFEDAMTPEEKSKLYKAIGYQENAQAEQLPEKYEAIRINFSLYALEIGVFDEITKSMPAGTEDEIEVQTILQMKLSLVTCRLCQRPGGNALKVKVGIKDLLITGYKKDDFAPTIIESIVPEQETLLDIVFETNPIDKNCDQRVKARAKPLQIVYDAMTVIQLAQVFTAPSSVNVSNLAPQVPLGDVKHRSALGFQYMVESHPKLEVDIKFLPSIIVIPHSGVYKGSESSVVVLSLGKLVIITEPRTGDVADVQTMFREGSKRDLILKEMMERTYDRFKIEVQNIQILVAKSGENWSKILNSGEMSDMHILCPTVLAVTLALCLIDDDPRLPKKRIKVELPSVKFNITEERIFEALAIGTSIPLPEAETPEERTLMKASSFGISTASIKKMFEGEAKEKMAKAIQPVKPEEEMVQYTDLDAKFTLKEFVISLYKEKEEKETTPSDQYKTPVEEFTPELFEEPPISSTYVGPVGHEKILSFRIIQLEAQLVQRTYDMTAAVKLGAIALNQFDRFDGKEDKLTVINTPKFAADLQYLLTISYTNANKNAPEFKTKYNSTEQLVVVKFSSLLVVLHQESLQKLMALANRLQIKFEELQPKKLKDRYASAADDGILSRLKENLETIPEEDEKPFKKIEKTRRKTKVVDSIKIKIIANMEQVAAELTCRKRPIANIKVQNFNVGVIVKTSYTEVNLKLKNIIVKDLNPLTIHSKVLSIIGENALNCQVVLYNLDETANYNSDDMKIDVTMGCVKIVFLNWFVTSCLNFLGNFQAAQQAIANASAAAADAAKQNVVVAYEKATRLKFNVKIKAPIIIVPVDSKSNEGIALDLGYLSITNISSEIHVPESDRTPAVLDEIKLELKNLKLSRVVISPKGDSKTELHKVDGDLSYGLASNVNIFDPISFALTVIRNLSISWYKERPELDISGRIKSIELNVLIDDYVLLMNIVNHNLTEGHDEFPSLNKATTEAHEPEGSPQTKVEVHKGGGGDAPTEEGHKHKRQSETSVITWYSLQKQVKLDRAKDKKMSEKHVDAASDVQQALEKKKIDVSLKFSFQLDGVVVNLITEKNEGLASFGFYILSVKGTQLVDGTLSTSIVLCDMQLDDIRPQSKTKISKYLQRRESRKKVSTSELGKEIPYMVDVVAILKDKDTFAEVRICAFDLIISIEFLLKIAEFLTVPQQEDKSVPKVDNKQVVKSQQVKKKPTATPTDPNQKMNLILHLEEPDIILVESLDDFNTHAIIFNSEINLRLRTVGDKQLIYGDIKDLKMYMCSFMPEHREATKHFIIYPCTITLQGSTPENKGLHVNIKSSEVIINVSPATIELINKAIVTVTAGSTEEITAAVEPVDYSNIWAVANYKEEDHWFMRVDEALDALEEPSYEETQEAPIKPEVCIVELPTLIIVLESGVGYYTTPLLTLETKLNATVHDWSRQMKINGSLTLQMSYFNGSLAVWEPLIEPNERVSKTTGVFQHSPWEMNFELKTESKKSEDSLEEDDCMTKISIHSADILEMTISKTGYDLLMELSTTFSQAFDAEGLVKPEVVAPYVLENDTGFDLTMDFTKGMFTLHDYHIPSLNPKYNDSVNNSVVFQAMEEELNIQPDDVKNCKVSPNGKVYLKKKPLTDLEVPSSTSNEEEAALYKEEYLFIQIGGIKKQIAIPVSKADERYFPLYRDTNQEPWGIISQVSTEFGTTKVNIHGVLKIRNHFTTTITIYRMRTEKSGVQIQFVGDVAAGEEFHVPLHAIYASSKELYFSLPGYKRSVQGIKWNESLTDLSYSRQLQCDPVTTFEPFYINALREKTEVYYEVTSKFTLLSACYTIHLRPPLYLRNALPIQIKLSVAGCTVRQDGLVKGVEMEEPAAKAFHREDFLDYGEKEVMPGDVLHLPTVKLTAKSGEAKSYIVVRLVQYLEKDWSCTTEISENHEEYEIWTFASYDSVAKMDMELGVKYENRHGSLMLTLYCPFWMINKTGQTLSYRANTETVNVLYHPPSYEGPILFSFRDKYFFGKKRASIRVDSGEWSEKIPLDVAGSTGSVQCKANEKIYKIGVHNHLTHNSLTKVITFIPFYIVSNKAYFPIELQEISRPGDPWLHVPPNECVPLWPMTDTTHVLHARIPDEKHVSSPFKYTDVQCTLLKLKNKYGGINVDVHETEGGIFITFTEYHPGDAPGLIVNHTSLPVSFWEKGNVNERILQPFQQLLFAWADAAGTKVILWDSGKDIIENDLRRDGYGQFQLGETERDLAYWVSFLSGTQRVLLFTERTSILAQAESSANLVKVTQQIEVSIHGIGLSVINNLKGTDILYIGVTSSGVIWESKKRGKKRYKQMKIAQNAMIEHKYQEFLNDQEVGNTENEYFLEGEKFRVDFVDMKLKKSPERDIQRTFYPGIWIQLKTSDYQTQIHAKINRIQIDNQLIDCIFPVVLAPIPPPKSVAATTALKPFVECSIVQRIVPYSTVKQFKYASMLIQEFHVKVDLQFITALSELFVTATTDEEAAKLFNVDLKSITMPLSDMVATQSQQEQKNFYDNLHLGPLKIHVSFSMAGSDVTALPGILSTILQGVGVTLTDINDVVFRLAFFEREYQFLTHNQLISEIQTHYTGQFLKQVYVLVFGLDVLGNPYGLVVGISKGVEDLFYEPFQGAIQGPGEFAEGLALGVKSLFGHAVGGAAGAVSKITGAMGKGIAALTFDKDYQRKRRAALHKKPSNFQEGIARSGKGLVMGVVDGVTGVFTKPIAGAKEQGVEGFFKGLGKGAVGLVARPTAGVVDFASGTLETVRRAAESTEDVHRVRPPRFLHSDGVVRPYTRSEAEGNKILREIEKGKYAKTDVFCLYDEIIEKQEIIILSNHRIIYANKSDLFGHWVIQWTYRWKEIGMIRSMDRGVEIILKKEDKKILGLFSSSEAPKKILLIPQKVRRDFLANKMENLRIRAE